MLLYSLFRVTHFLNLTLPAILSKISRSQMSGLVLTPQLLLALYFIESDQVIRDLTLLVFKDLV